MKWFGVSSFGIESKLYGRQEYQKPKVRIFLQNLA